MKNLVIVESPTKAQTLARFLGRDYQIEASMGHIRDLPKSTFGVDVDHNFEPHYIIPRDKAGRVKELQKTAQEAENLWLATDPDREGEAIAWHINELLGNSQIKTQKSKIKNKDKQSKQGEISHPIVRRVVFHEITPEAIKESFDHPRNIDYKLVDAQQGRRVLDRLVGYKLSPLLWKKVKSKLSAGRVQSVALRLIVEREEEIKAFAPVEYWSVAADLEIKAKGPGSQFQANLIELNGEKLEIRNKEESDSHLAKLEKASYKISSVTKKEVRRYASPPFTTSTLQQTASNRLGMTAKKTMQLAQNLYEKGLITYMRTDSVHLATPAVAQIRKTIEQKFGKNYLPPTPNLYKTKSKLAQEAHEAIRPTNPAFDPAALKQEGLTRDHARLYELIWKRAIACQMADAVVDQTTVDVDAALDQDVYKFRVVGSVVKFDGWLKLYIKDQKREEEEEKEDAEKILPELTEGEKLALLQLLPEQHFTEPPPRFNEASLIKKLEELGIGRPSTYAPIISTIQNRFYVEKLERKFVPTELGIAVITFLKEYFKDIIDYDFTAQMEDELDEIANGNRDWRQIMKNFYQPFSKKIEETFQTAEKVQIETEVVDKKCPKCGKDLTVRFGRFGKFLACTGYPDCTYTENLLEKVDIPCPQCGGEVVIKRTRKGRTFYGCANYPKCKFASWTKPK